MPSVTVKTNNPQPGSSPPPLVSLNGSTEADKFCRMCNYQLTRKYKNQQGKIHVLVKMHVPSMNMKGHFIKLDNRLYQTQSHFTKTMDFREYVKTFFLRQNKLKVNGFK